MFSYSWIKLILLLCLFTQLHTFQTHFPGLHGSTSFSFFAGFFCIGVSVVLVLFHPLKHCSSLNEAALPSLTRGTGCFIFLFLFLFIIVFSAGLRASLPIAVRVLRLQDVYGGRAGPAGVVREPPPAAAAGALRRGLDALGGQGSCKLLCAFLDTKRHNLQEKNREVLLLVVRACGRTPSTCIVNNFPLFYKIITCTEIPVKGPPTTNTSTFDATMTKIYAY